MRDLVAISLLTEPRQSARSRLDILLGTRLVDRVLDELGLPSRRVA